MKRNSDGKIELTTIRYLCEENANEFGEYLRGEFFDQSRGEIGGYSTFILNTGVKTLSKEPDEFDPEMMWNCFRKKIGNINVEMCYHWDGDGILEFHFDDYQLVNSDCKKDDNWQLLLRIKIDAF